jgi:hypothetical protein
VAVVTAPMSLELKIALKRLVYLQAIRATVLTAFGPGAPTDKVLASDVAKHVADALGRECSPWLRRDVTQAMQALAGWRSVMNEGYRLWRGVKRL